uniref:Uncharacterized protein n=1 Tax=Cucumis melo TaxID=3656 RepID=A0A9I9E139_CUCME
LGSARLGLGSTRLAARLNSARLGSRLGSTRLVARLTARLAARSIRIRGLGRLHFAARVQLLSPSDNDGGRRQPLGVLSASGTRDEGKEASEAAIGVRDRSGVERRSGKKLGCRGGSTTTIGRRRRFQVKLRRGTRLDGRRRGDADEGGSVR